MSEYKNLISTIMERVDYNSAMEEVGEFTDVAMSEDVNVNMQISLVTDKLIENSKLKKVTDPIPFSKGAEPTEGGVFSRDIFGYSPEERQRTFGYIDLGDKFFHPYVFEILRALIPKKLDKCAIGKGSWEITEEGELREIPVTLENEGDIDFDNSGIKFLVENYHKLKIQDTGSKIRGERLKFLNSLDENEIFITKWLVIPVFYRDLDDTSAAYKIPELDVQYNDLIRYSNSLKDTTFDFFNNQARYNIQRILVDIRKRGQKLIAKKHGFFQKAILGKSIDRGSRDVISTATLNGYERPDDNPIDSFTTGIPLAKCCILGYDFIMRYCLQFFNDNFKDIRRYPIYKENKDGTYEMSHEIDIKNQLEIFTSKYIDKKINRFKNSHETRFEVIELEAEDGTMLPLRFSGLFYPLSKNEPDSSTIITRSMTWTDLFYMAAYDSLSNLSVYITRYPITSHNSIFPTKVFPLSTIKTCNATIRGKKYKNYPVIDLKHDGLVSNLFNDTVTFSNLYLSIIGGDFDGDTVGSRVCFTLEANKEAEDIAISIKSFVDPNGKPIKVLGNESHLTYYNMTRTAKVSSVLSNKDKAELLKLNASDLTVSTIAKLFGTTMDSSTPDKRMAFKRIPPRFNILSKFTLNPGEYINKEKVETTVGKFLFNKLLVEGNLEHVLENGYINDEMGSSNMGAFMGKISLALINNTIQVRPHMEKYLKAYEFWGLRLTSIFATSFSPETVVPNRKVEAAKKKLIANKKDDNVSTLVNIDKELLAIAAKELEGTTGKLLFDSGARGAFDNAYKTMNISMGTVENPVTKEYDFAESSLMDGISKKDLVAAGNNIVNAEYPKAIGTAEGGYLVKQFYSTYQGIVLDDHGTNCGSKGGLTVILTKKNLKDFYDQYIITPKGLVLITENTPSEYLNKPIMIRSPMYCITDKICNKCAGERFYKVDIKNIGLVSPALPGAIMNANMKMRHDMTIKVDTVDINDLLL